jgi:Uncharacterised nucleotidyltransferase
MEQAQTHAAIGETLRKAAAALRKADVPFMLGGSFACWARGGPRSQNDLDLMVPREDVDRAVGVLAQIGMRAEDVPEEWLVKVWDRDVMVDLIFDSLATGPIAREHIDAAERISVLAISMPVMSTEDVLVAKLLTLSEQRLDYGPLLEIARALRESIDWDHVAARTRESPYARAFFALLAELEIAPLIATR